MIRWILVVLVLVTLISCADKSVRNPSANDPSTKSWTKNDCR